MDELHELLVDGLRDLYDAEKQLVKALPKMAKALTSPELKESFNAHLEQTKNSCHSCRAVPGIARREGEGQALQSDEGAGRGSAGASAGT